MKKNALPKKKSPAPKVVGNRNGRATAVTKSKDAEKAEDSIQQQEVSQTRRTKIGK